MKTIKFTDEELLYLRRAIDVYTSDLREYIKETGHSALDPTIYDGILDRIDSMIGRDELSLTESHSVDSAQAGDSPR